MWHHWGVAALGMALLRCDSTGVWQYWSVAALEYDSNHGVYQICVVSKLSCGNTGVWQSKGVTVLGCGSLGVHVPVLRCGSPGVW